MCKEEVIILNNKIPEVSLDRMQRVQALTQMASPTGDTYQILKTITEKLEDNNVEVTSTNKGGLLVTLKGNDDERHRFITAHVDTLGAIVRAIKPDGRLKIDKIGGYSYDSINGTYCTIHQSLTGREHTGTILLHQTSVHVYADATKVERSQDNMEIRLDEEVTSAEDVKELGIQVGDFISFDLQTTITDTGYIKSRHLDDKVSVALLLELVEKVVNDEIELAHTTHFYISNNEEIGYGGNSNIHPNVEEYMAVDMGAMGDDQQTDEYSVSICVKDSSGPYNLQLRNHLVGLCEDKDIPYQLDIYPLYGSDASAAMSAGADVRHGLFGAGIDASHAYERTHYKSIDATYNLVEAYLTSPMMKPVD